jgi:carboxylesterase type B
VLRPYAISPIRRHDCGDYYRLGPLGIFAQPAIDGEGHLNANYSLMDQHFALVGSAKHRDRNRVMIFGESAGGLSIYSNLA